MFWTTQQPKKSKSSGFAEGVRALSELLSIGMRLATTSGVLLLIYVVRDGLAEAFTRDFVRLAIGGVMLLIIGAGFITYKAVQRMAEAAEHAALAIAEAKAAEARTAASKADEKEKKNEARMIEMQAQFQALLVAGLSGGGQPKALARQGAPRALRRDSLQLEVIDTTAKGKKNAFGSK